MEALLFFSVLLVMMAWQEGGGRREKEGRGVKGDEGGRKESVP